MSLLLTEISHKIYRIYFRFTQFLLRRIFLTFSFLFLHFYPNNNAILLTRSKVWTKRRFLLLNNCSGYPHCATIDVYFHRFTCRFKSLLMYIGTDKSICIRVLLLKFPIQFPHTLFDVKSFILFLWQHRRKGGGGQRKLYKTVPDAKLFEITTQEKKKKHPPPLFFFWFQWYNNTPEKEFV